MAINLTRLRLLDGINETGSKFTPEEISILCRELYNARDKITKLKADIDKVKRVLRR